MLLGALPELDLLRDVARRLAAAAHGETGRIMDEAEARLQMNRATIYARLKKMGLYHSGRKQRADKGRLSVSEEVALKAAGLVHLGTRAHGKRTYSLRGAKETLEGNGIGIAEDETGEISMPSATTLARAMRAYNCHPKQLEAGHPALSMRSLHPNHVWQVDMSVATLFYAPDGGVRGIAHLDDAEVYKNKPDAIARVQKDLCTRWLITDHCSDAYFVRYMAGHEDAMSFIEFLIEAIQARSNGEPMHGVPLILVMDAGAAGRAAIARNLLDRLGVKVIIHRVKNSRAKGSVEGGHNRWEMVFESRLALWRPSNLDELNARADEVRRAHCAKAKHSRHGMTRYAAWMRIRQEQLRLAPSIELCRELVTTTVRERTVTDQLLISYAITGYGSQTYDVRHIPGVQIRTKVRVVVNPYRAPAIDVLMLGEDGTELAYTVEPAARDEFGFMQAGNVWGEAIRALPESSAERQMKKINQMAYNVPTQAEADKARKERAVAFDGEIDPFADFAQVTVPQYLTKRGTEHVVTTTARELPPVPCLDAVRRLKAAGESRADLYQWLVEQYGAAVPAAALDELETAARAARPLRAVGGV